MGYKGDRDRTKNRNQYEYNYEQIDWTKNEPDTQRLEENRSTKRKQPVLPERNREYEGNQRRDVEQVSKTSL